MKHVECQEHSQSQSLHWRIIIFSAILALAGLLCIQQLNAGVYKWVDEYGVTHYSNVPPAKDEYDKAVFEEYHHDDAAHQKRLETDQEIIDAVIEEFEQTERQARVEEQMKLDVLEMRRKLEDAKKSQPYLETLECLSLAYSIQQGRGIFDAVIPRYLMEGEYDKLQNLLLSLDGDWKGNSREFVCEGPEENVRKVVYNYSTRSEGRMLSNGKFYLKSTLYSRKKKSTHDESLELYLDPKELKSGPHISDANIELISVTPDELVYNHKTRVRSGSGVRLAQETITIIKRTGRASFWLEKIRYLNGRLKTINIMELENR